MGDSQWQGGLRRKENGRLMEGDCPWKMDYKDYLELAPERPSECGKDTGKMRGRLGERRARTWGLNPTGAEIAYLQVCRQRRLPKRNPWEKEEGKWRKGQKYPHSCPLLGHGPNSFTQPVPLDQFHQNF